MKNVNERKKQNILYWSGTFLLALWFGASGFLEITKNPAVYAHTIQMGYPPLFIVTLGIAKLIGVLVLIVPGKLNGLKEWVFAALFFDLIFAVVSGYALGGTPEIIKPLIAFILVLITYITFRKLNPVLRMSFNN